MLINTLFLLFLILPFRPCSRCGTGAVYNEKSDMCYKFHNAALTFQKAEAICATLNGHMATAHSLDDNSFLIHLASQYIHKNSHVWLGAQTSSSTVKNPYNWKWTDGTLFDYQNYNIIQPISVGSSACMQFSTEDGKWLTANCEDDFPFICAFKLETPTTSCPSQQVNRCPSRYVWLESTKSCYKTVVKIGSFTDADQYCKNENAELASIHSRFENEFLVGISMIGLNFSSPDLKNNIYIGLIYLNGGWQWTDGTSVDYLNWASGEPKNMDIAFWTALMPDAFSSNYNPNGGQWNNIQNQNERGFICKKPAFQ